MKSDSSTWLIGSLAALIIAVGGGYWYSCSLRNKVTEIWKVTLWEDCTNRMREINVKKKHVFYPTTSSDIKIDTEGQTLHLKKDSTESLTADEKSFLADQYYLSKKNPVKIEKLDSLFQLRLKEKGLDYKTAVSLYNNDTKKKTFYGQEDVQVLHDYLKLTYKVDIQDVILLEGYVKGNWFHRLLWGSSYYIILSLIILFICWMLVMKNRKPLKSSTLPRELDCPVTKDDQFGEVAQTASSEPVSSELVSPEPELSESVSPEPTLSEPVPLGDEEVKEAVEENIELSSIPLADIIYLDEEKHTVTYAGKTILLAPKLFGLFYYLLQGKDHFQSYEFLIDNLWREEPNAEKRHVEQIKIRLQKSLEDISDWEIATVRGSGYQLDLKKELIVRMER